ncbi:unnamed protein product [Parajaminaea phylloscopi]
MRRCMPRCHRDASPTPDLALVWLGRVPGPDCACVRRRLDWPPTLPRRASIATSAFRLPAKTQPRIFSSDRQQNPCPVAMTSTSGQGPTPSGFSSLEGDQTAQYSSGLSSPPSLASVSLGREEAPVYTRDAGSSKLENGDHPLSAPMSQHSAVNGASIADGHDRQMPPSTIHIEVRLKPHARVLFETVTAQVRDLLTTQFRSLDCESYLDPQSWAHRTGLAENVDKIRIAEGTAEQTTVATAHSTLQIHVYQVDSTDTIEELAAADPEGEDDGNDVTAATVTELPCISLDKTWDILVYEDDLKQRLLRYIHTAMVLSDANVDFDIVTWNRLVLLHGPPGTGKTTLCRALAQKAAIRLSDRYSHGKLVEINSHSLFSKWFSESGKLVQRLFAMVTEMVEDEQGFVVILIDEVESLTAARSASMSGGEPSDALRVVNAVLTQLDKLKQRKNVLIMTTSNISQSIDDAFVDRADIKQYVGPPPTQAVYWILKSCLDELMRAGLAVTQTLLPWQKLQVVEKTSVHAISGYNDGIETSRLLWALAEQCKGVSGRTLRRLPVLALARHLEVSSLPVSVDAWIGALQHSLRDSTEEAKRATQGSSV